MTIIILSILIGMNTFALPHQSRWQRFCTTYLAGPDLYELDTYSVSSLIWAYDNAQTDAHKIAIENELRFRLTQSLRMGERNKIHQALERQ